MFRFLFPFLFLRGENLSRGYGGGGPLAVGRETIESSNVSVEFRRPASRTFSRVSSYFKPAPHSVRELLKGQAERSSGAGSPLLNVRR